MLRSLPFPRFPRPYPPSPNRAAANARIGLHLDGPTGLEPVVRPITASRLWAIAVASAKRAARNEVNAAPRAGDMRYMPCPIEGFAAASIRGPGVASQSLLGQSREGARGGRTAASARHPRAPRRQLARVRSRPGRERCAGGPSPRSRLAGLAGVHYRLDPRPAPGGVWCATVKLRHPPQPETPQPRAGGFSALGRPASAIRDIDVRRACHEWHVAAWWPTTLPTTTRNRRFERIRSTRTERLPKTLRSQSRSVEPRVDILAGSTLDPRRQASTFCHIARAVSRERADTGHASSAALEQFLQSRLILRDLLGGLATRQWCDQLSEEDVAGAGRAEA